ncbi:hypothetical protein MCCPILRI181_00846 [Mycoplasma capricolum subsp. capripneumoniae]|nr:hypothetical protein MCCP_1120 [Mycoplasma capricolum subsp. capripneumoniae 99108]WGD33323.1 hypothetical protein Mccp14020TZ_08490 [Mycoplasma capricolum subsp. capripneumoniae]CEA11197.1 hypothetical protein MCCPILRI181_00846 [Mycoplasma capricolum subsp. capripneumoniae]CEA12191.1 hypothetical protein MCCPF38_00842 [Mycoplasma capricolum subsp. capripneumoniae]
MLKSKKLFIPLLATLAITPVLVVVSCKNLNSNQLSSEKVYLNYNLKTESEKQEFENYNQINMLSEINQYFIKHDYGEELVKFTAQGASGATVEFNNIMKNNYASKYMKFDETKFKEIIKKEFNLSDNFLKRLEFEVDYNNISRDYGNNFDIIFPIRVKLPLVSHKNFKYQEGYLLNKHLILKLKM